MCDSDFYSNIKNIRSYRGVVLDKSVPTPLSLQRHLSHINR